MSLVYHHIDERPLFLYQVSKILKKNGRFINIDNVFNPEAYIASPKKTPSPNCRFPREKFIDEATSAGFKLVKSHNLLKIQYIEELRAR